MTDDSAALSVFCAAREAPNGIGLVFEGREFTWQELAQMTGRRLESLQRPAPGRPFPLVAANTVETVVTFLALLSERIPALMLHPRLTPGELESQRQQALGIADPLPEGSAAVLFTSGTTGRPKAAILPRSALLASAAGSAANIGWQPQDRWQMCMSIARVGGLSILTRCLATRHALVLVPKFRAETFPQDCQRDGVTITSLVPTMLAKILEAHPDWTVPERMRVFLMGGAAMPASLLDKARRARVPAIMTYGMTETCSHVAMTPYAERYACTAGSGEAVSGAQLRIQDGCIQVCGPMLMAGYWGQPPLPAGSWFSTGDIGQIDGRGRLAVFARRSDLIISGGDNVYPAEVEAVLENCPYIAQAQICGIPDEVWGAIVCAELVPSGPIPADAQLVAWIRANLAPFKRPRLVSWVSALPATPAGKPDRGAATALALRPHPLHYTQR